MLILLFAACKRSIANSKRKILPTRLVHQCTTWTLTPHALIRPLQLTKDAELPPRSRPRTRKQRYIWSKNAKDRGLTVFCQFLSLPIFVLTFFLSSSSRSKTKATHQTIERYTSNNYNTRLSPFLSSKTSRSPLGKPIEAKFLTISHFRPLIINPKSEWAAPPIASIRNNVWNLVTFFYLFRFVLCSGFGENTLELSLFWYGWRNLASYDQFKSDLHYFQSLWL